MIKEYNEKRKDFHGKEVVEPNLRTNALEIKFDPRDESKFRFYFLLGFEYEFLINAD